MTIVMIYGFTFFLSRMIWSQKVAAGVGHGMVSTIHDDGRITEINAHCDTLDSVISLIYPLGMNKVFWFVSIFKRDNTNVQ